MSREVWSRQEVRRLIESAQRSDPRAGSWMRLNYLTACRPSETLRLVKGEYVEESSSLVVLSKHKTSHSGQPRFVLLSAAAQVALDDARRARPAKKGKSKDPTCPWNRLDTYSNACYMACGKRPHLLRHSAATSLLEHGVARAEVDLILGHSVGSRVSLTYMKVLAKEYERLLPATRHLVEDLTHG